MQFSVKKFLFVFTPLVFLSALGALVLLPAHAAEIRAGVMPPDASLSLNIQPTPESERILDFSNALMYLSSVGPYFTVDSRQVSSVDAMKIVAKKRSELLKNLIVKDPALAFSLMMPPDFISSLPADVKQEVEAPATVTGQFSAIHVDKFSAPDQSKFEYYLASGGNRYDFFPVGGRPGFLSGSTIRVKGYLVGNKLVAAANSSDMSFVAPPANSILATGDQRLLVVLLKFSDSPPPLIGKEEIRRKIFSSQIRDFFSEASYGRLTLSGDVTDWYALPRPVLSRSLCDPPTVQEASDAVRESFNIKNYSRIVLIFYHPSCAGLGLGSVGPVNNTLSDGSSFWASVSWIGLSEDALSTQMAHPFPWTPFDFVFSHEFGHNLGVIHANRWECGAGNAIYGNCEHGEYGNYFDVMGIGLYSLHFNAMFKEAFGWLSGLIQNVTTSGVYQINSLESSQGARGLKVKPQGQSGASYFLEYREARGFDSNLNKSPQSANLGGLFINWRRNPESQAVASNLLDMSPASLGFSDWNDVTLRGENVFSDPGRGVKIGPIISHGNGSISFRIDMGAPQCLRRRPFVNVSPFGLINLGEGYRSFITFPIENLDTVPCGPSEFESSLSVPSGWAVLYGGQSGIVLTPESEPSWGVYSFRLPVNVQLADYTLTLRVKNLSSGLVTEKPIMVRVEGSGNKLQGLLTELKYEFLSLPRPQRTVTGPKFRIGDTVMSTTRLNVRENPSIFAASVGASSLKTEGVVLDGPVYEQARVVNYTWWKVQYRTGVTGWSAEDYLIKVGERTQLALDSISFVPGFFPGRQVTVGAFGVNFKDGAKIIYSGPDSIIRELPTTFVSSTELTSIVTIPSNIPEGIYAIRVKNSETEISNDIRIAVGGPKGITSATVAGSASPVASPAAGDQWIRGQKYTIRWNSAADSASRVQITLRDTRFPAELGSGEAVIAASVPNTGSYEFTVPASLGNLSGGALSGNRYRVVVYFWNSSNMILGNEFVISSQ